MPPKNDPPLILVIDDQDAVTVMLKRIFETEGFQVHVAYNGEEGLREAARRLPDLILLDVMMPGLNGFDVLQLMRKDRVLANTPVIMITAKDTPSDIERGLELGADDYIPKPFHPRELLARVRSKIRAYQLEQALGRRTKDLEALLRVSEALNRHLEINEVLNLVSYLLLDLLPCKLAAIYRLDEQGKLIDHVLITHPSQKQAITLHHQAVVHDFLSRRTAIIWPESPPLIDQYRYGMAMPLQQGDSIHGFLVISNNEPFDADHFMLFEGISRQAALSLRNAELYEIQREYAEHLEEMVEERTRELKSAQQLLVRSEKLASLGRMAAGIAHEINNPLQPIRIHLEGMLEDIESNHPIDATDVTRTLESVERIGRIVHRFLEFTGKGRTNTPHIEQLDMNKIIETVLALNETFFNKENIVLVRDFQPLPLIFGNRDHMEQVFLNLMLNAKAALTQKRGGKIHIKTYLDGSEIVIEFSDTGQGIASDLIDQIFEPFVTTKEDGTGLGLFITYNVIQNHQGSIEVNSQEDVGTTFIIRLPTDITPDTIQDAL